MKSALNDILRISAQFFGLVPLESDVAAPVAATEQNAAPTVTA